MTLIEFDGIFVNPETVCLVDNADREDVALGFLTELVLMNGKRLLKDDPRTVATRLAFSSPSLAKCSRPQSQSPQADGS